MSDYPGKLIVIDGTDGSGKATQLGLLKLRLEKDGYEVMVADFPQYNQKSAGLVEEYLSGKYGQADDVTPYQASIFYAVDRFDASTKIRNWLKNGKIVLANRYTSANMGHQGGKIANPLERKAFFNWLYELEYKLFNIPKPDLSIILHVEATVSQKLAQERARSDWSDASKDIHENNLAHLQNAEKVYLEIADSYPEFELIRCTKNGNIMTREEISLLVWLAAKKIVISAAHQSAASGSGHFKAIGDIISSNRHIVNNRDLIFNNQKTEQITKAPDNLPVLEPETKSDNHLSSTESSALILPAEKILPDAQLPQKAHPEDAGFDLYAADYYSIPPYGQALVRTGIKLAIPAGCAGLIWDKSGLANEGITTLGGVIDSNYRGEIKVVVKNLSEDIFNIIPGRKIAQILIQALAPVTLNEEKINNETTRAAGGFGSTGKF